MWFYAISAVFISWFLCQWSTIWLLLALKYCIARIFLRFNCVYCHLDILYILRHRHHSTLLPWSASGSRRCVHDVVCYIVFVLSQAIFPCWSSCRKYPLCFTRRYLNAFVLLWMFFIFVWCPHDVSCICGCGYIPRSKMHIFVHKSRRALPYALPLPALSSLVVRSLSLSFRLTS